MPRLVHTAGLKSLAKPLAPPTGAPPAFLFADLSLHDVLRRHQTQRRAGFPVRLPHQGGPGPDQLVSQDDAVREGGRPLHGAAVRRQSVHLAIGARDPADRADHRPRRGRAHHHLERQEHVRCRARAGGRRAPCARARWRGAQALGRGLQRVHGLRWPDQGRGHAPVPGVFGRQLHRGHVRDALLPGRRVQVRQARARPRAHARDPAGRGRQVRPGVHGQHTQVQPLGGPAAGPGGLRSGPLRHRQDHLHRRAQPLFPHAARQLGAEAAPGVRQHRGPSLGRG